MSQFDEILVKGAFGQQVSCKLVRLPFRIFNPGNSDQVTKIMCAVTDMLEDEDMLLSGHDYVVLMENCRKDRSVLIPEDDYSNVLPFWKLFWRKMSWLMRMMILLI